MDHASWCGKDYRALQDERADDEPARFDLPTGKVYCKRPWLHRPALPTMEVIDNRKLHAAIEGLQAVLVFGKTYPAFAWLIDEQQAEAELDGLIALRDGTLGT